jgi:hypothetical protein
LRFAGKTLILAPHSLDRLLIFGRRQLEHVLRVYIHHFNQQRPHRALDLRPPEACARPQLGPDPLSCSPSDAQTRSSRCGFVFVEQSAKEVAPADPQWMKSRCG